MFLIYDYEPKVVMRQEQGRSCAQDNIAVPRVGVSDPVGDISSACSCLCGMESHEPVSEISVKPVFKLAAKRDFRYEIQDVPAFFECPPGCLGIYFSLAGAGYSMN
jgi:hypothetical protein